MSSGVGRRARIVACAAMVMVLATALPAAAVTVVRGDGSRWRPASVSIARGGAVKWSAVFRSHVVKAYGGNWSYRRSIAQGGAGLDLLTENVRACLTERGTLGGFRIVRGAPTPAAVVKGGRR